MKFLHDVLLTHCNESPDRLAVISGKTVWSYGKLKEKYIEYKKILIKLNPYIGDRILLILENSPEAISLSAACSSLGIIYIPVDPVLPRQRLNIIIEEIDPICIISKEKLEGKKFHNITLKNEKLYFKNQISKNSLSQKIERCLLDSDIAYIIYTSGSTGKPKGIMMTHLAAVSFLKGLIKFYQLDRNDRYATTSPFQFDYALLDIGLCLGSGATLIISERKNLRKLKLFIKDMVLLKVNHISGVPTIWNLIIQLTPKSIKKLSSLKRIVFAGEHFPKRNITKIYEILPNVRFINIFGQSESIACFFNQLPYPISNEYKLLPIGKCHEDCEIILIDKNNDHVTSPNVEGEIYLRGKIIFSGYWKNILETKKSLVQNPIISKKIRQEIVFKTGDIAFFDAKGIYYYIGRKDSQIQINGNRVELKEIESVLCQHKLINDSCVIHLEEISGNIIHAFIVPIENVNNEDLIKDLQEYCTSYFPNYMMPRCFHMLKQIPVTINGKTDSNFLINHINKLNYENKDSLFT